MISERTLVGVPFFEKEGQDCLDVTLQNINRCLATLAIDAVVVVQVNGPETASGHSVSLTANTSQLNAEVEILESDRVGQAHAVDDLIEIAKSRGIQRAFLTDADIYRFPDSMRNMWDSQSCAVVGASYRPYPIEVVEAQFGRLNLEERLLYQIFDGDQSPTIRRSMGEYGIHKQNRVKASLMLVDVDETTGMHDGQDITTDSVMNRMLGQTKTSVATDAFFMHMGRVDMTDHIQARLRHFRAAAAREELNTFLDQEFQLPKVDLMDAIAQNVRDHEPDGDFIAMLYLSRCAVREKVNSICLDIASGEWDQSKLGEVDPISMQDIKNYADACRAISRFFVDIDWGLIEGLKDGPPPVTQERLRQPFDVEKIMSDHNLLQIALDSFGFVSGASLSLS